MIKNYKINLFKKIYFYRKVELEIANKYSEQKMRCPTHLSVGQESISAAFALCVKKKDLCVCGERKGACMRGEGKQHIDACGISSLKK